MLVLTRAENQKIKIGNEIRITVLHISGGRVRLGIEAPADLRVLRTELEERDQSGGSEKASV